MGRSEDIPKTVETLRWDLGEDFHDHTVEALYAEAARVSSRSAVVSEGAGRPRLDRILDRLVTNRWTGFPLMTLILAVVFWITIEGANVPSAYLASILLDTLHPILKDFGAGIGLP